jgi:hypothetical protein
VPRNRVHAGQRRRLSSIAVAVAEPSGSFGRCSVGQLKSLLNRPGRGAVHDAAHNAGTGAA